MTCGLCEDTGWVCENHPGKPWDGDHACGCGAAGMPCMRCNPSDLDDPPRPPAGMHIELDKEGWRAISAPRWSREFEDPIVLADGRKLVTLRSRDLIPRLFSPASPVPLV